jgi:hypothetical protein
MTSCLPGHEAIIPQCGVSHDPPGKSGRMATEAGNSSDRYGGHGRPGEHHVAPDGSGGLAPEAMTRIMLRPMASGLPLGFFAFGAGTILLTSLELQ